MSNTEKNILWFALLVISIVCGAIAYDCGRTKGRRESHEGWVRVFEEHYPQLKTNAHFQKLTRQLIENPDRFQYYSPRSSSDAEFNAVQGFATGSPIDGDGNPYTPF